jgi:hypothetical protein
MFVDVSTCMYVKLVSTCMYTILVWCSMMNTCLCEHVFDVHDVFMFRFDEIFVIANLCFCPELI